jgi:hypothetical protein
MPPDKPGASSHRDRSQHTHLNERMRYSENQAEVSRGQRFCFAGEATDRERWSGIWGNAGCDMSRKRIKPRKPG